MAAEPTAAGSGFFSAAAAAAALAGAGAAAAPATAAEVAAAVTSRSTLIKLPVPEQAKVSSTPVDTYDLAWIATKYGCAGARRDPAAAEVKLRRSVRPRRIHILPPLGPRRGAASTQPP